MASDNEACCESDPNFAVICGFLEKFGVTCGLANIDFLDLQDMLENNQEVPQELVDLHVKLLRKARKSVSSERWERAIIKLCHGFCSQDAWEIERFGYKNARLSSKLRILKELLEMQFDYNVKFKNEINKLSAEELRTQPIGRDRLGHIYWFQSDNSCQIRVYKEDPDEETWALVAKNKEGLLGLITHLNDGKEAVVNEDSNSLESEKPVVDTGQIDSNSNSNSSKLDQTSSDDTNTEEPQECANSKEAEVDQFQGSNEEDTMQNNTEILSPTKIRVRGKKALLSEDLNRITESDNSVSNVESNGNVATEQEIKSENNVDKEEKDVKLSLAATPPKTGISIRIKPIAELISPSAVEVNKKVEITGVKEKYIRSDSTSSSSIHHRKAVDSAGFVVHTNYLKRPIDEEEDVEEPSYVKRPRLDRPTLLGNKKKKPYSDEDDEDEEEQEEVSDEVNEPLMLVRGEGSGHDNEDGNCRTESENTEDSPIVGETIEESVVFFHGEGAGHDCETGNDNNSDKSNTTAQQEGVTENKTDVGSTSVSSQLNLEQTLQDTNKAELTDSIKGSGPSSSYDETDCSGKFLTKPEFKLGTIIDVRTNNLNPCVKILAKKSRWDIGKPEKEAIEYQNCDEKANSNELCIADKKLVNFCEENLDRKSQPVCNNNDILESQTEKLNVKGQVATLLVKPVAQEPVEEDAVESVEASNVYSTNSGKASEESSEAAPKKSMFFFGPGCLQVKPSICPLKDNNSSEVEQLDDTEPSLIKTVEEESNITRELCMSTEPNNIGGNIELKSKAEGTVNDDTEELQQTNISSSAPPVSDEIDQTVTNEGTFKTPEVGDISVNEDLKEETLEQSSIELRTNSDMREDLKNLQAQTSSDLKIEQKDLLLTNAEENVDYLATLDNKQSQVISKTDATILESKPSISDSDAHELLKLEHEETTQICSTSKPLLKDMDDVTKPQITEISNKNEKIQLKDGEIQGSKSAATSDPVACTYTEQVETSIDKESLQITGSAEKDVHHEKDVEKTENLLDTSLKDQPNSDKAKVSNIKHDSTKYSIANMVTQTEKSPAEILNTSVVKSEDMVEELCSDSSNSVVPANHHVPKNSISVSEKPMEKVKSSSPNDDETGDKLNDVPVPKPFLSDSAESEKSKLEEVPKVIDLPVTEKQVENVTVVQDKPKSKLENVLEKINQVKLVQKTDSVVLSIKNKDGLLPDSKLKSELHMIDSKTCSIETQMAIIMGEKLPNQLSSEDGATVSSSVKIAGNVEASTLLNKADDSILLNEKKSSNTVFTEDVINVSTTKNIDAVTNNSTITDVKAPTSDKIEVSSQEKPRKILSSSDQYLEDKLKEGSNVCSVKPCDKVAPTISAAADVDTNTLSKKIEESTVKVPSVKTMEQVSDKIEVKPKNVEKVKDIEHKAAVVGSNASLLVQPADDVKLEIKDSTKKQLDVKISSENNQVADQASKNSKIQSIDDTILKECVRNRIFSSIDKSLNDAKCLIPDKSQADAVYTKEDRTTDVSVSNFKTPSSNASKISSNSSKSNKKNSGAGSTISLTEILSTSMKVPEVVTTSTSVAKELSDSITSEKSKKVAVSNDSKSSVAKPIGLADASKKDDTIRTPDKEPSPDKKLPEVKEPSSGKRLPDIKEPMPSKKLLEVKEPSSSEKFAEVTEPTPNKKLPEIKEPSSAKKLSEVKETSSGKKVSGIKESTFGKKLSEMKEQSSAKKLAEVKETSSGKKLAEITEPTPSKNLPAISEPSFSKKLTVTKEPSSGKKLTEINEPSSTKKLSETKEPSSGQKLAEVAEPTPSKKLPEIKEPSSTKKLSESKEPSYGKKLTEFNEPSSTKKLSETNEPSSGEKLAETVEPTPSKKLPEIKEPSSTIKLSEMKEPSPDKNLAKVKEPTAGKNLSEIKEPSSGKKLAEIREPTPGKNDPSSAKKLSEIKEPSGKKLTETKETSGKKLDEIKAAGKKLSDTKEPSGKKLDEIKGPSGKKLSGIKEPSGKKLDEIKEPSLGKTDVLTKTKPVLNDSDVDAGSLADNISNKMAKQQAESICEVKESTVVAVTTITEKSAEALEKESTCAKSEKNQGISIEPIDLNTKSTLSAKVKGPESPAPDITSKSNSKDSTESVSSISAEEKLPSRRITRRTRSSTTDKLPDTPVSNSNKSASVENMVSTSLSKLEETRIKTNLPQVCIKKMDLAELNDKMPENSSVSNSEIQKAESAKEVTEVRKRGKGAAKTQNSEVTYMKTRGKQNMQTKQNKLNVEVSVEQDPSVDINKQSTKTVAKVNKKDVEVGGNNRELRERKIVEKTEKKPKGKQMRGKLAIKATNKEDSNEIVGNKQKTKINSESTVKPNEGRSFTRTRAQLAKDKEITTKTDSGKENLNEIKNTNEPSVDMEDIEEQIVRTEIRPSKKLKLADSVEVTVVDKNKRVSTTHVPDKSKELEKSTDKEEVEDKKEVVRRRRTSNRLSSLSGKTENADKNAKDQQLSIKQEEPLELKKSEVEKQEQEVELTENKDVEELKPVDEPKCVQKKVALLTCVDVNKLQSKGNSDDEVQQDNKDGLKEKVESEIKEMPFDVSDSDVSCGNADYGGDSSDDVAVIPESDPLGCSEDDSKGSTKNSGPMTLATFKLDIDDASPSPLMRVTRKRAAQQSIDALRETRRGKKTENKDNANSKRLKLKRKRSIDRNLRRSIEEKKSKEISSSEEDAVGQSSPQSQTPAKVDGAKKSKSVVKRRVSTRSTRATESPAPSSDAPSDASRTDNSNTPPVTKQRKPRQTKKTLMGLEISPETVSLIKDDTPIGVRQSRRIAQIKIKEEAERRKLEEVTLHELKEEQRKRKGKKDEDKDYKLEKRKKNKNLPTEDETTTGDAESDEKKKRKRKRKHRDPRKHFDALNPWKSSSGSSSSEIEEEEDEIEEDDDHPLVFKSDHEFSPESDLEEGAEVQPLKRARTARKESDAEEEIDDCACQKCGQKDHPEWILLCDSCDCGWHCSCLRPALLVIPEGDWFCPPCQHGTLVKNLEAQLVEHDKRLNKKVMETRRKERLAYVGISLDNVLPAKESDEHRLKHRQHQEADYDNRDDSDSDSDDSRSDSDSSSSSDNDSEPIYQLRERRQAHSYRFNDYDELINSAIQDELDAVKGAGNQGRGKDISTIVNAEKEEEERLKNEAAGPEITSTVDGVPADADASATAAAESGTPVLEPLPPVVPVDYDKKQDESDDEIIRPVKKIIGKKKHRKLNSLDVSSGDDAESDEDFKGSSTSESEDFDDDEYAGSDSSDGGDTRRGKRRKDFGPVRRSTRARISRYDRDFINDNDSDSDADAPRRKKTRSLWDESESEESDRSWGRRKRKAAKSKKRRSSGKPKKSKKKKKKRTGDDSDPEVYRKRPNIKFGGLNDDDEEIGRRTRGKKINYLEALGTDSEEEIRRKPPRIEESEEEYIVHDDEDFQHQLANDKDSDESGVDTVLHDLAMAQPKPKPRGRGKGGLKILRESKEPLPPDLFPPLMPDLQQAPPDLQTPVMPVEPVIMQQQLMVQSLLLEPPIVPEHELQDIEDEPNPIEQINKNVEQMNEQEMEKMMEEEDYANKQLQLVALQIEKEKKRKEREAKRLEKLAEKDQKVPKKRGRKPKNQGLGISADLVPPFTDSMLMNSSMANNAELSEPPGINLPMFSEIAPVLNADGSPKKRRGRGKGKKTLAAEAAANKDSLDLEPGLQGPASFDSNTLSPAAESPMHGSKLGIATPPQPFSQSQPSPSVITRMLQSQPGQGSFPGGVSKYFGGPGDPQLGPPGSGPYHPGATGPRGSLPGPYQQPPPGMSHYPIGRSVPAPPLKLHSPGPAGLPPMYHAHRSLDPSPSGGGPINVSTTNRDRHSPAVVPPASSSPLSKGDPTPPPPPYTRPQVGHFPPVTGASPLAAAGSRHVSMVPPHLQQQHRTSSMSPYHPGVPPNYHYGSYPPPPPLNSDEGQPPPGYPSSAYPEPYPAEGGPPIQPPEGSAAKSFDEDTGGEFVGLVSYFSSQREDDLDT